MRRIILRLVPIAGVLVAVSPARADGPGAPGNKTLVVLVSGDPFTEWSSAFMAGVREARTSYEGVDVYFEFLDHWRFPRHSIGEERRSLLRKKYAERKVDALIAESPPAAQLMMQHRVSIFGPVPCVVVPYFPDEGGDKEAVIGLLSATSLTDTVRLALRLHPKTTRVVVLGDQSDVTRLQSPHILEALEAQAPGVEVLIKTEFPMAELERDLAALKPNSLVFMMPIFRDATGESFVPENVSRRLAAVSAAPIYAFAETFLGTGVVGGDMLSPRETASRAVRIALSALGAQGKLAEEPHVEVSRVLLDWRALQKWHIGRIPKEAEVRFKPRSVFEDYLVEALLGIAAFAAETLLLLQLGRLLMQRNRLHRNLVTTNDELRDYAQRLLTVREDERRLMAHEIHDEVGQVVSAASVQIGQLLQRTDGDTADSMKRHVEVSVGLLDSISKSVRRMLAQLRPAILDERGLNAALEWLVLHSGGSKQVQLDCAADVATLHPLASTCIFRIVQESLTNIQRHAKAQHVTIELADEDGDLVLWVDDNGCGFDEVRGGTLGLTGMRQRAAALGGTCKIESRVGQGTSIEVRIPAKWRGKDGHP